MTKKLVSYDDTQSVGGRLPASVRTEVTTIAQPIDSDLTAIAALTTTTFGRSLLAQADAPTALGTLGGQPVDSDLTAIAALTTTTYGRSLLTQTSIAALVASLGLSTAVTSLATYDTTGATDGAPALQTALNASPVVYLKPGSTLLLNSPVFLDSLAALGTSFEGTYIIDGQGTATLKIGSSLVTTVAQYSPDTTRKWAIHLNTERTSITGNAVSAYDGSRTTGSSFPMAPRLVFRNCILDGGNLNAGLVFSNTAAVKFENPMFLHLKNALCWTGYADGSGIFGGQAYALPTDAWLIDQITNGDGITISDFKGLYYGVWRAKNCNSGVVRNNIMGNFDLQNCHNIILDGGHGEHWDTSEVTPVPNVPLIKLDNCDITVRRPYCWTGADPTIPYIAIDETNTEGAEYASHVVIEDATDLHFYQAAQTDPAWSPFLKIVNINTASTIELRRPTGQAVVGGLDLSAGASFHISSADAGVTAALADGRFASEGGKLACRNGAWEVAPVVPGLSVSRALPNPSIAQATVAESNAVGTLAAGTYYYVMALLDTQGRYTGQSSVVNYTSLANGAIRLIANAGGAPARVVIWRKLGTGVQTAPDAYAVLPITTNQLRLYDTGVNVDGTPWITTGVPIPNTVASSNQTANTAINPSVSATGVLQPCQAATQGAETYTIVGGSVTQIAGLTINLGAYTPVVGDRILIPTAPAASGAGTGYATTTNATNGVYVVTSLAGGNIALSRAADLSGSVNPAGLLVFTVAGTWSPTWFWAWIVPAVGVSSFTWGTTNVGFAPLFGTSSSANGSLYAFNAVIGTVQTGTIVNTGTKNVPTTAGMMNAEQMCTLTSAYTLTSQTAAQKLFNASANGAVTLPVGTYYFECFFSLSALNTGTSSIFGWNLAAGTATIAGISWESEANAAALTTPATPSNTVNTAANTAIVPASTAGVGWARIKGKVRISAAGTVIPQVSLNTAAAAVVGVDSFFRIWQAATSATAVTAGTWT